jgi:RNAse (barnase) inhibitor barstar
MRIIELDAKNWRTGFDFYRDLLAVLGAPKDHGGNLNAVIDSMIWGGMNTVEPPYTVRVLEMTMLPKDLREEIELLKRRLDQARIEFQTRRGRDVEVNFETP